MSNNHNLGYDTSEQSPSQRNSSQQQQLQNQMQISMESDINLTQLREREAALHKLENDITDVNMIFKDLAVMVHDQGDIIDSIESNVEQVQIRVNDANAHLIDAKKNQVDVFEFICGLGTGHYIFCARFKANLMFRAENRN